MFGRKRKQEKLREAITMIKPTSKASLKATCLYLSNLNVEKAEKMYDFLVKDMTELPDVEPASQPFIKNFGEQANGVMNWFRENKDMFADGWNFIQGVIANRRGGVVPPSSPLPPING